MCFTVLAFEQSSAQYVAVDTSKSPKPVVVKKYFETSDSIMNRWTGKYLKNNSSGKKLASIEWRVPNSKSKLDIIELNPPPSPPAESFGKIKIPVGVIRWDSWASTGMIVPGLRAAFTAPETQDYAPWFSRFTAPEYLEFSYYKIGNQYPETEERLSSVIFEGDRPEIMEKEVEMARGSGIDFWAFNWYPDEATQSYARRQFTEMSDKKGMKAAYITELVALEDRILNHFVWAFQQDWYQYVDGKPLLILAVNSKADHDPQLKFLKAVESRCGCKTYSSWQSNDWASDKAQVVNSNRLSASTLYGTWNGVPYGRKDHAYIMEEELKEWNSFLNYPQMDLGLNVTISFTNLGVYSSPLNNTQSDMEYQFKNNTSKVATDDENREQLRRARNFIDAHPTKVKYMMLYSWNEHTEGLRVVNPRKKRDGTIDRTVLDIVGEWVE